MALEDWARLVYIFYLREKHYWFTLEQFARWIWKHNGLISIRTIEANLEKMVKKGYLRKLYVKYVNEYGLPVRRKRYEIILPAIRKIVQGGSLPRRGSNRSS